MIGAMLKDARLAKALKTTEVGRILKIDTALISKFESGGRLPTESQLSVLSELLSVDYNQLKTAWLKAKILQLCEGQDVAIDALQQVLAQLNGTNASPQISAESIQKLMDDMDALKSVLATAKK
ncbi:MAG: helix-turn-helix transcriptional regulator [Flavobacterium sp.]|nr:helix-turn-helix transcriptional regulator [Flavobacterium sp.]